MLNPHNLAPPQQCPRCDGGVSRENYAEIVLPRNRSVITMLLCEHCDRGIESVWNVEDGQRFLAFSVIHDRRENPVKFGMFVQRLKDQVCVAA